MKIKGDSFIRNNIENKIYQGVEIEGNIEYYKIDSEYHDIKSVTGEKIKLTDNPSDGDSYRGKYDDVFHPMILTKMQDLMKLNIFLIKLWKML